jgi:hypothetical protein
MSYKQEQKVRELPKGACSRTEHRMLHILARLADDRGTRLFPSHGYLARRLWVTERWVQMVVRKLRQRGWLKIEQAGGGTYKGGRGRRNGYILDLPVIVNEQPTLEGFPQTFPQFINNPDQKIEVPTSIKRSLYPDLLITPPVDLKAGAAMPSPVEKASKEVSTQVSTSIEGTDARAIVENDENGFQLPAPTPAESDSATPLFTNPDIPPDVVEHMRMLKASLASPTPKPARRRRGR